MTAAGEVIVQLLVKPIQEWMSTGDDRLPQATLEDAQLHWQHASIGEFQQADAVVRGSGQHRSERRVDQAVAARLW